MTNVCGNAAELLDVGGWGMFKTRLRIALVVAAVLLPFIVHQAYYWLTALPRDIVVATGPENGLYRGVWKELGSEIERQLGVTVEILHTGGSAENLRLLEAGDVDFCLCQSGTDHFLGHRDTPNTKRPKFVASLYSEVVHILVRPESGIQTASDLKGKHVNIGDKGSGDNAMAMLMLEHLGLTEKDIELDRVNYYDLAPKFRMGSIDAAIVTIAPGAPLVTDLISDGTYQLIPIPHSVALSEKRLFVQAYEIPSGYYRSGAIAHPRQSISTVAVRAQLLTSEQVSSTLVGEVTRIALSEEFIKSRELTELFSQGDSFAKSHPEFSLHPGAINYYEPELRTYLNPDFVR